MADELTVLLVSAVEPDENLVEQLEKQGLFAERCLQNELADMLAMVEPALVVQLGSTGAAETTELLRTAGNVRRVRLVVVADRKDLPELRKLDRAVVVSLLATDIAPSVVAARVSMLARKGPGKTEPPPNVAEPLGAAVPASPPRAVSKKPVTQLPSPASPLAAEALAVTATPKKSLPRAAPPPGPAPTPGAAPTPRAAVPQAPAAIAAKRADSSDKTPIPAPRPRPAPVVDAASPSDLETSPKTVRASVAGPAGHLKDAKPRLVLADSDMTRADLVACVLREAGISVRLVPLDAAATRWKQLRSFQPNILLADSNALKGEGQVWYQLFQADEELRRAKIVTLPFERLFSEQTGTVNLSTLLPQIPQVSNDLRKLRHEEDDDELDDDRPTLIHEPAEPAENGNEGDSDRPTISADPVPQFDDETQAFDLTNLASEADAEFAVAAKGLAPAPAPVVTQVDASTIGRAAPLSLAQVPQVDAPPSDGSLVGSTISNIPEAKRSGRMFLVAAVLVAAGGGFFAWNKGLLGTSAPSSNATSSRPTPPTSVPAKPAPVVEAKAPELTEEQRLWFLPPQAPVPQCSELVPNLAELSKGGIQQANLSWDRARLTMVLGDLDKAQVLMCEAALIHPESLALEGLAGLYVSKRAPEQAMEWTKKALAIRPDRRKTLELEGDVLSLLGKPDEARALWIKSLGIDDSQRTLDLIAAQYVTDAEFQLKGGAVSQAERLYRRAATFSPENVEAAAGLANAFFAASNPVAAQAWADRALSIKPEFSKALVVRADLLNEAGETEKALTAYREILKTDPGNARAHQQIFKLEKK